MIIKRVIKYDDKTLLEIQTIKNHFIYIAYCPIDYPYSWGSGDCCSIPETSGACFGNAMNCPGGYNSECLDHQGLSYF